MMWPSNVDVPRYMAVGATNVWLPQRMIVVSCDVGSDDWRMQHRGRVSTPTRDILGQWHHVRRCHVDQWSLQMPISQKKWEVAKWINKRVDVEMLWRLCV